MAQHDFYYMLFIVATVLALTGLGVWLLLENLS